MSKGNIEGQEILTLAYVVLAFIFFIIVYNGITNKVEASKMDDKFILIDTSLTRDTAILSPGILTLNYNYGDREINIEKNTIKSNKLSFPYISDLNKDLIIRNYKGNLAISNTIS